MANPELVRDAGRPQPLGADVVADGVNFAVRSATATQIWVSLFDERDAEIAMLPLEETEAGVHCGLVAGIGAGARYGLRAEGRYAPAEGFWFDPAKLLVDPYARQLDRHFVPDPRQFMRREGAGDSAPAVPKAFVVGPTPQVPRRRARGPQFIYELSVRGHTMLHPDVQDRLRGTVAALGEPAVVEHLVRLGVDTVELMPVAAWIDEPHLRGLGLTNFWGYNPVTFMAPDPRLMHGGVADLAALTDIFAAAGISVILDVVLNHTGEGDRHGATLSLRGLDNLTYYRHHETERGLELVDDSGCGNTVACDRPAVVELALASLRHWVAAAGVAGFRFDLATILGRTETGFDRQAPLLAAIRADPVLGDCILVAEPWDVGPDGYRLGAFGPPFGEWNDAFRDDVRRYWRGDEGLTGEFATRLAGSADVFGATGEETRSVNFIAAHDGFTLADLVAFSGKDNFANREGNRDGHDHNYSWNNGAEGETSDPEILARRTADLKALIAIVFLARGTAMLKAGDELGKSQSGNNNAYAQDNPISWIDWQLADAELIAFSAEMARLGASHPALAARRFLSGAADAAGRRDCVWLKADGDEMDEAAWQAPGATVLGMMLAEGEDLVLAWFNRGGAPADVVCPPPAAGGVWRLAAASTAPHSDVTAARITLARRSVTVLTAP